VRRFIQREKLELELRDGNWTAVEVLIPGEWRKKASSLTYEMVIFNYRNISEGGAVPVAVFENAKPEAPFAKFLISSTEVRNAR